MSFGETGAEATVTDTSERRTPLVDEVCEGVFIVDGFPTEALLAIGGYLTHRDFEQAGIDAGTTAGRGLGVFNTIAFTSALGLTYSQTEALPEVELNDKLYYRIFYMMKNPQEVKAGSRDRVLLGTQFVHDTFVHIDRCWSVEGSPPITGKIGHRVLELVLFDVSILDFGRFPDKLN